MPKLTVIVPDDLEKVMVELRNELISLLRCPLTGEQNKALDILTSTLLASLIQSTDYLPQQEQADIAGVCGTCIGVGMLFGKSPQLVADVLKKSQARLTNSEVPDWLVQRIADAMTTLER